MNNFVFTRKISSQTKWMFIFVVMPLYFFFSSIIGSAILKFLVVTFSLNWDQYTLNCYLNVIIDVALAVIVILIFKDQLKAQWHDLKNDLGIHLLYGCVFGPIIVYVGSMIGGLITILLGSNDVSQNQSLIESIFHVQPLLMFILNVLLAPLIEEVIYRGIIFSWLYEFNAMLARILSGFIFGFSHVMIAVMNGQINEMVQIFPYFFIGILLSYLYEKRNNIYVPMMTHGIYNFIATMQIFLM